LRCKVRPVRTTKVRYALLCWTILLIYH